MSNPPLRGLEKLRDYHGKTMAELGHAIGVTASQYRKFEKGHVRLDVYRAQKLARFFGCSIDQLL